MGCFGPVFDFPFSHFKDIFRSFPTHKYFAQDSEGSSYLRRVLISYSWHNAAVGYCQAMVCLYIYIYILYFLFYFLFIIIIIFFSYLDFSFFLLVEFRVDLLEYSHCFIVAIL
jgi:hypothetical protein